jgi:hypothetical protein
MGFTDLAGDKCGDYVDQVGECTHAARNHNPPCCGAHVPHHRPNRGPPARANRRSSLSPSSPPSPAPAPSPLPPLPHLNPPEKRAGWITKVNIYDDGKCLTGIKPTYGYKGSDAKLLGKEKGKTTHIELAPHNGEFITKVEVKVGR